MPEIPDVKIGGKVSYTRPDGQTVEATKIGGDGLGIDLLAPIPGTDSSETVSRVPHSTQLKTAFWEPLAETKLPPVPEPKAKPESK